MITKQNALEILKENIKNENLRKHHYAVACALRALAEYFNEAGKEKSPVLETDLKPGFGELPADQEKWEITGLLHDADYEETKDDPERHALVIAEKLESLENYEPSRLRILEDIIYAIKAHNFEYTGVEPKSLMDWSLVACDDLTGLIVAVALVHPDKLESVTVDSVMKKFDSPSFAAGANRSRIKLCEEKLGIPLEEFIGIVLSAMKQNREQLGL
jgi:predicted hydrolase (HD superfamily)